VSAVVPKQGELVAPAGDLTPPQMLQMAIARGVDTEQLKELMQLQREWKADQAREAFTAAMNKFRSESIVITKNKSVMHGDKFMYKHALLSDIVDTVAPRLSEHGLSHRWETKQDGNAITVSCIITHEMGHSIQNSLTATPDTSGSKNSIQAIGSTVTYLQRYTFLAITGLAARDTDNDGAGGDKPATITDEQVADLEALMSEIGIIGAVRDRALKAWKVETLNEIRAQDYAAIVKQVEGKRK
jgi:hypothetical protein